MDYMRHFHVNKKSSKGTLAFISPKGLIRVNDAVYQVSEHTQCTLAARTIRNEQNNGFDIFFGYALFNPKDKNFNKKVGVEIAQSNMKNINGINFEELPKTVKIYYKDFLMEVIKSEGRKIFLSE